MSEFEAAQTTHRILWPLVSDQCDPPCVFVTTNDCIGIKVNGLAIIKPLKDWHALAFDQDKANDSPRAQEIKQRIRDLVFQTGNKAGTIAQEIDAIAALFTTPPAPSAEPTLNIIGAFEPGQKR